MTDLIKILNNPEEHYPGNFDIPQRANALLTGLCQDAANEIERLNAEVLEQCRINGMSAEREDALRAELTRLKASIALDKMAENARDLGLDYEPTPVQDLPFGVGGGLVAIKTLLGRDPCVHANTAIEMIDAILKEHPAAQPAVHEGRDWSLLAATQESLREHMAEIKRLKAAQPAPVKTYSGGKPWPVAPKPWVGLSEDEINKLRHLVDWTAEWSYGRFAYELERLLREKNHG
jgi:hypothetical protein